MALGDADGRQRGRAGFLGPADWPAANPSLPSRGEGTRAGHLLIRPVEQLRESGLQALQFVRRQRPEPTFYSGNRDRLGLLKMENARPQKRPQDRRFPPVGSHSCSMRDDDNPCQLVIRGGTH